MVISIFFGFYIEHSTTLHQTTSFLPFINLFRDHKEKLQIVVQHIRCLRNKIEDVGSLKLLDII